MFCDVAQDMFLKISKILFVRGITSQHLGNMIKSAMLPPQCVLVLPALKSENQSCVPVSTLETRNTAHPDELILLVKQLAAAQEVRHKPEQLLGAQAALGLLLLTQQACASFSYLTRCFPLVHWDLAFFIYHPLSFSSSLDAFQHSQFNRFELHRA